MRRLTVVRPSVQFRVDNPATSAPIWYDVPLQLVVQSYARNTLQWSDNASLISSSIDHSRLSSLEDGLPFLEEGFTGFLGVLATEGDANIGQLVAELLFHVAGLERFHHAAF